MGKYLIETTTGGNLHYVITETGEHIYERSRDIIEVVRCKDCIYWQDNNGGYPHEECRWGHDETPNEDDYCSYGERKDD